MADIIAMRYRSIVCEVPYVVFYLSIGSRRVEVYRTSGYTRIEAWGEVYRFYLVFEDDRPLQRLSISCSVCDRESNSLIPRSSVVVFLDRVTFCGWTSFSEVEDEFLYLAFF